MQNGPMMNPHAVAAMQQQMGPRGQGAHGVHPMAPRIQAPTMQLGQPGIQGMPPYAYANQSTPQAAKVGKKMRFVFDFCYGIFLLFFSKNVRYGSLTELFYCEDLNQNLTIVT